MGRSPCCSKEGMKRGAWTSLEDQILIDYIKAHGEGKWRNIPKESGLKRCGKSCRLRWLNYLRPDIKRGNITRDEEDLIVRLHKLLGNRWSLIAGRLPGRTDNEIKNYWNTNLSKKAQTKQSSHSEIHNKPIPRPPSPGVTSAKPGRQTDHVLIENHGTDVAHARVAPSIDANLVNNVAAESESSDGSREEKSSDFTMDFNVGEIGLLEILDSDFTILNDFDGYNHDSKNVMEMERNGGNNGCKTEVLSFPGEAFLKPEGAVGNWSGSSTDFGEANMGDSDFGCLASFLGSSDEWIF